MERINSIQPNLSWYLMMTIITYHHDMLSRYIVLLYHNDNDIYVMIFMCTYIYISIHVYTYIYIYTYV